MIGYRLRRGPNAANASRSRPSTDSPQTRTQPPPPCVVPSEDMTALVLVCRCFKLPSSSSVVGPRFCSSWRLGFCTCRRRTSSEMRHLRAEAVSAARSCKYFSRRRTSESAGGCRVSAPPPSFASSSFSVPVPPQPPPSPLPLLAASISLCVLSASSCHTSASLSPGRPPRAAIPSFGSRPPSTMLRSVAPTALGTGDADINRVPYTTITLCCVEATATAAAAAEEEAPGVATTSAPGRPTNRRTAPGHAKSAYCPAAVPPSKPLCSTHT